MHSFGGSPHPALSQSQRAVSIAVPSFTYDCSPHNHSGQFAGTFATSA